MSKRVVFFKRVLLAAFLGGVVAFASWFARPPWRPTALERARKELVIGSTFGAVSKWLAERHMAASMYTSTVQPNTFKAFLRARSHTAQDTPKVLLLVFKRTRTTLVSSENTWMVLYFDRSGNLIDRDFQVVRVSL